MHYPLQIRKILILILTITCVVCLPIYAQDQHTVLLYTFETGSGTTVNDLSDYGNDGELMAAEWGVGKIRGGLTFGWEWPKSVCTNRG